MLVKTFVCEEHEEYGGLGWREKGKSHFDPYQGLAVAHDCLEHFPNDRGTIEDEMMALGAGFHTRYGMPYNQHEWWENIQADCVNLFQLYRYDGVAFNSPPENLCRKSRNQFIENQIDKLVESLPEFLRGENGYEHESPEDAERMDLYIANFTERVGPWVRHGFRRAKRRWRGEAYYIGAVFTHIRDEADRFLKFANAGDEIKVIVNMKRYDAQ